MTISNDGRQRKSQNSERQQLVLQIRVDFFGRQNTGQNCTQGPADCIHSECVERIVITKGRFQERDGNVRKDGRENPANHCACGIHETAGRRDDDQSGNRSIAEPEYACLTAQDLI